MATTMLRSLFKIVLIFLFSDQMLNTTGSSSGIQTKRDGGDEKLSRHKRFMGSPGEEFIEECQLLRNMPGCSCEPDCVFHDDCCMTSTNPLMTSSLTTTKGSTCQTHDSSYYWVVRNCPIDFLDKEVSSKCQKFTLWMEDPNTMIPVYSKSRMVLFRNIYCAICHNITVANDLVYPDIEVSGFQNGCRVRPAYSQHEMLTSVFLNEQCHIRLIRTFAMFPRDCYPELSNACGANFSGTLIRELSGFIPGPEPDTLEPEPEPFCSVCKESYQMSEDWCKQQLKTVFTQPPRAILNITLRIPIETLGTHSDFCASDEILDNATSECKKVFCRVGEIFTDGRCVQMFREVKDVVLNLTLVYQYISTPNVKFLPPDITSFFVNDHIIKTLGADFYVRRRQIVGPLHGFDSAMEPGSAFVFNVELVYIGKVSLGNVSSLDYYKSVQDLVSSEWKDQMYRYRAYTPPYNGSFVLFTFSQVTSRNPCKYTMSGVSICGPISSSVEPFMGELSFFSEPRKSTCPFLKVDVKEAERLGLKQVGFQIESESGNYIGICLNDFLYGKSIANQDKGLNVPLIGGLVMLFNFFLNAT